MGFYRIRATLLLAVLYLGVSNGYLAIYESKGAQPLQILPYPVSAYPQADQNALARGIPFDTREQLNKLLEDFTS